MKRIDTYICEKVENILDEAELYGEVDFNYNEELVWVTIYWGDWKHDHARLRYVMGIHGFSEVECEVIDADGSDCYSAIHKFKIGKRKGDLKWLVRIKEL